MIRRIVGLGIAAGVLAATSLVWQIPVFAAIVSDVTSGALTVTGDDEDDVIEIRCGDTGNVKINRARPDSGAFPCTGVTSITVAGSGGHDEIQLRRVEATAFASLATVSIDGGPGRDSIEGSQTPDTIAGGDGDDRIVIEADDVVDGGLGHDSVEIEIAGEVTFSDSTFSAIESLHVTGSDGTDTIDASGFSGTLSVRARDGGDSVVGGSGHNSLDGGFGDDALVGGPKSDHLSPGDGDDSVSGRGGRDFLGDARGGSDLLIGGPGNDTYSQVSGTGNELRGGPGIDYLSVETLGSARLTDHSLTEHTIRGQFGRAALSSIERATLRFVPEEPGGRLDAGGFSGATYIQGSDVSPDVLIGGSGRDEIQGLDGDDSLIGGAGRDRLFGGAGIDSCDGGPGRDRLVDCE